MTNKITLAVLILVVGVIVAGAVLLTNVNPVKAALINGGTIEGCTTICVWDARGTDSLCWADCPNLE